MTESGLPADYADRVYAGVLGKIIGVYLGRPFEGWSHERIGRELGDIDYYVHDRLGVPLLVTDDDIAGTFTFVRALADHGNDPALTAAQIGRGWLNYIIENRTILWWGGLGNSTEHTAFLRLKNGIEAPQSGSIERNGAVVAEQIGAQIFIDGWAMVAAGRPRLAADFARRAGSVSHDGVAVHAAQALAAMEARAFVESDIDALLDTGLSVIPAESLVTRMIHDIRGWHDTENDWRVARNLLDERYGYHIYGGNCHVIPNHGLIILALLYGGGDWDTSMKIVNTCGWDTDCNSGNLGCLLGIRNGLSAFDGPHDWRGPVADRLYLPGADGGRTISDAAIESLHLVNSGRALVGLPALRPKDGARFHFEFPGSVQGFGVHAGAATISNEAKRLRIAYPASDGRTDISTPTFIPPEAQRMRGYQLLACPTLCSGQRVSATVIADDHNAGPTECALTISRYNGADSVTRVDGPAVVVAPGATAELSFVVPDTGGQPVASVGIAVPATGAGGVIHLHRLSWAGTPDLDLDQPADSGSMWHRAWVSAMDQFIPGRGAPYRLIQNSGRGLLIHGTREWRDYAFSAVLTPHLAEALGIAVRVQGLRRYLALLVAADGTARVVRVDHEEQTLAETRIEWELGRRYALSVRINGDRLRARIDDSQIFDVTLSRAWDGGGVALISANGRVDAEQVRVRSLARGQRL